MIGSAHVRRSIYAATLAAFVCLPTVLLSLLPGISAAQGAVDEQLSCLDGVVLEEIGAAADDLDENPDDPERRMALASVLTANACYWDAVRTLEAGGRIHPGNRKIERQRRDAQNVLDEQRYFASLDRADEEARLKHNLFRCRQLLDHKACKKAIRMRPEDAAPLIAAGDAHLASESIAAALELYYLAQKMDPGNDLAASRIEAAEQSRQQFIASCLNGRRDLALDACKKALLRGAPDEFEIHKRRGILYQESARPAQALDAYIAAMELKESDESVARAIVSLSDRDDRQDAPTLLMRGRALLAISRPADALKALQAVHAIDPEASQIDVYLARARRESAALASASARTSPATRLSARNEPTAAKAAAADALKTTDRYSNEPLAANRSY